MAFAHFMYNNRDSKHDSSYASPHSVLSDYDNSGLKEGELMSGCENDILDKCSSFDILLSQAQEVTQDSQ